MLRNPTKFEKYYENKVQVGMSRDAPTTAVVDRMMADQQKRMAQKQEAEANKIREQETLDEAALPSPSGKVKGSRTVKKFMNDQAKFEERRAMKLEEIKNQEESSYDSMFKYTASNKSKMILEKKKLQNEEEEPAQEVEAHERLYATTKEVAAMQEQSRAMKPATRAEFSYQPQIN